MRSLLYGSAACQDTKRVPLLTHDRYEFFAQDAVLLPEILCGALFSAIRQKYHHDQSSTEKAHSAPVQDCLIEISRRRIFW